jgi:hypothetical protein
MESDRDPTYKPDRLCKRQLGNPVDNLLKRRLLARNCFPTDRPYRKLKSGWAFIGRFFIGRNVCGQP